VICSQFLLTYLFGYFDRLSFFDGRKPPPNRLPSSSFSQRSSIVCTRSPQMFFLMNISLLVFRCLWFFLFLLLCCPRSVKNLLSLLLFLSFPAPLHVSLSLFFYPPPLLLSLFFIKTNERDRNLRFPPSPFFFVFGLPSLEAPMHKKITSAPPFHSASSSPTPLVAPSDFNCCTDSLRILFLRFRWIALLLSCRRTQTFLFISTFAYIYQPPLFGSGAKNRGSETLFTVSPLRFL